MAHRKCAALKLVPSVGDSCGQQAPWAGAAASRNQRSGPAGGDNGGVRQISAVSTGWHGAGGDDGGDGGDDGGEGGCTRGGGGDGSKPGSPGCRGNAATSMASSSTPAASSSDSATDCAALTSFRGTASVTPLSCAGAAVLSCAPVTENLCLALRIFGERSGICLRGFDHGPELSHPADLFEKSTFVLRRVPLLRAVRAVSTADAVDFGCAHSCVA
eukprot:scaffold17438_cov48-Phaeocystis_antarctica.AAC.1